jgi:pullulanase
MLLRMLFVAAVAWSAPAAAAALSSCDGAHETVLAASPSGAGQARAAWLDAQRLRWAGVSAGDGAIRLLHSRRGQTSLFTGERAHGADGALTLDVVPQPMAPLSPVSPLSPASPAQDKRFSHIGDGVTLAVRRGDLRRLRELHRGQLLLVQQDGRGRVLRATSVQAAGALDALYAAAESVPDLGAVARGRDTRFQLWAPTAQRVTLCLYGARSRDKGKNKSTSTSPTAASSTTSQALPMRRDAATGIWSARVPHDLSGRGYAFAVDVFVRGKGLVRNLVTDPYSLSLSADSKRSVVVDLHAPQSKPPGWDDTPTPRRVAAATDMTIYELHLRDFSAGDASVPASHRGKYLAFTHADSDGMKHLKALSGAGVTDVHLLPMFDLASVPEQGCTTPAVPGAAPDSPVQQAVVMAQAGRDCFNWGYDPWHFSAPEGSFASDAGDGIGRVREMRAMVQALHRANLRVGMDMVYNHTAASGQHAESVLDRIVPGYYQRLNADGAVETSSCCDNTATEQRMMAKLMIDSAVVWAREHRIDSLRFDLMGHQPRDAMVRLQRAVNAATGRHIHLIGEGWNFGEVKDGARFVQAAQGRLNGSGIATFSDRARDAARGSAWGSAEDNVRNSGWIHGGGTAQQADLLRVGLAGTLEAYAMTDRNDQRRPLSGIDYDGQPAGYASQPGEVVNYVENHDNQTLFDNNVMKMPVAASREDRARVQTLAAAIVAFSQGIAYFHAGQEILRSKSLDRNSYDSGDWFNRLDWRLQDNGFGAGLPPARDNKDHWAVMQPLLAASAAIKPTPADIAWSRDAFFDLLRIRASTPLFRLRSAEDVQQRLSFHNTGSAQTATLLVGHLDGAGLDGANFAELVYLINADAAAQSVRIGALADKGFVLHPVHALAGAADGRAANASYTPGTGTFIVPARTAVVFVVAPATDRR